MAMIMNDQNVIDDDCRISTNENDNSVNDNIKVVFIMTFIAAIIRIEIKEYLPKNNESSS